MYFNNNIYKIKVKKWSLVVEYIKWNLKNIIIHGFSQRNEKHESNRTLKLKIIWTPLITWN